ncbi:MAG: NAD-dependent epimerase/dehydratase family protein [Gemmatimonadetes bacterium]|nr:NAD-dependent epimerase/dehydratase family protein [Gemmatimonadota bacterium]
MTPTRREFLKTGAAAASALGLGMSACSPNAAEEQVRPLSILILGGTGFIGPHMVRYAQSRGHTLTLFNRGRTNTHLFPEVEKLKGDRDGDLLALEGRTWDVVIDNSGFVPRLVRDSAELLHGSVGRYIYVSSVSAYADFETPGFDEDYTLGTMEDNTVEEVTGATYGPLKVLCEQAVQEIYGAAATIVRPHYIVGPGDSTDRWTYWPVRVAEGGEVAVPGTPTDPIQFIDARDLTGWMIRLAEDDVGGVYNGVGPEHLLTMEAMLAVARDASGSDATFTWMDADFLGDQNASFPIWSAATGETAGLHQTSGARARQAGLTYRPLDETIRDTLAWWAEQDDERRSQMRAGFRMRPEVPGGPTSMEAMMAGEVSLLERWRAQTG